MSDTPLAPLRSWLSAPLDKDVSEAIDRLRLAPDVEQIAVMPDVHLSADVCIGVVIATSQLIYPQAVGGDIGCGMLAVGLDIDATALAAPKIAGQVLSDLGRAVPVRRRNRSAVRAQPGDLEGRTLSDDRLDAVRRSKGILEFATLGSGNHFIELQADEQQRLWLMVHSGSRVLGQTIRDHHLARAQPVDSRLRALDARSDAGAEYLHDLAYARHFAASSRRAMAEEVGVVLSRTLGANVCWETLIATDHNHVALERHVERDLWVHRKGAMGLRHGESGVLPGSMGSLSFHVEGRGCEEALCSSAHGAGRAMSRTVAWSKVTERMLRQEMEGVWYDVRLSARLRDEAPSAYKDVRSVLKAQRELVKVTRTLRPILSYKGL